jgi:hypothetical protein
MSRRDTLTDSLAKARATLVDQMLHAKGVLAGIDDDLEALARKGADINWGHVGSMAEVINLLSRVQSITEQLAK